jgi:hypothetical protein
MIVLVLAISVAGSKQRLQRSLNIDARSGLGESRSCLRGGEAHLDDLPDNMWRG